MSDSKIEWTDRTWNIVVGCTKVSRGCRYCYAEILARRFMGIKNFSAGDKTIQHVFLKPEKLNEPLHWRKPQRVFVNSMSDLFHEDVPDEFIDQIFAVMKLTPWHTYQVLTKRPERMMYYLNPNNGSECAVHLRVDLACYEHVAEAVASTKWVAENLVVPADKDLFIDSGQHATMWPLPNVWLGVSVEDQKTADERIPLLLQTPAAVRFVSYEPALGPVDFAAVRMPDGDTLGKGLFSHATGTGLDWLICGGESGPGARPFDLAWARSARDQCDAASVAFFMKQVGSHLRLQGRLTDHKGGNPNEWPEDLRVREFPKIRIDHAKN